MNYYDEIKKELVNNEIYKRVKDYSKNRSDLNTYYNVGKILAKAGKKYGEGIIIRYSEKLTLEIGKKYNKRTLFKMKQFYVYFKNQKVSPLATQLSWSHYCELLSIKDVNKINYYIKICEEELIGKRELRSRIKNNEYERLDYKTKKKLITKEKNNVEDFIKNPIIINNKYNYNEISEKVLKTLILEDISNFMKELGGGFSYIDSEYKIKMGNRFNYIDLLLYNIVYNCYVVVELKVTELKKEHIGQIETYMNYIDVNIRRIDMDKTIGIIISKKDNKFILEYCSDERILTTTYLISNM